MNSIVPNFTKDLLETVAREKRAREPQENKVVLSQKMAKFLQKHNCPGLGKNERPSLYLREGRKWLSSRKSQPYSITIGKQKSSSKKEISKPVMSRMMDA